MSKKHYHGHYQRLRLRFLEQGSESFQDYEAMELLLTFVVLRQGVKRPAKKLIERFGSFKNTVDAFPRNYRPLTGLV